MQFFLHYLSESTMLYIVDDDKCQLFPQKIESSGYVNQAKDARVERDKRKKKKRKGRQGSYDTICTKPIVVTRPSHFQ